jgi:drug/metabolite transporter (DMT)-like permease
MKTTDMAGAGTATASVDARATGTNSAIAGTSASVLKARAAGRFFRKGLIIAILSGMAYGLYSAFVTVAMGEGVWADWYSEESALTLLVVVYVLGVLGSGINDTMSAVWALGIAAFKGKLGDFFKCLRTKPGLVMIVCAIIGGPIASAAYIIAIQMAGSIVIPISALCPALGAILSRFIFKQKLTPRMLVGIAICLAATLMIGSASMGEEAPEGQLLGCLIAFIAALGWAIEGCVAGYGTAVIDYEIGITIRQVTSGLVNLFILLPIVAIIAGNVLLAPDLAFTALTDGPSMIIFVVSGFFALFAFSLWYKGNSMCGTALGMACNGAYSFWGPFFCWIVLGVFLGQDGWALAPIAWAAAIVMVVGILLIAVNPLELLRRNAEEKTAPLPALNYAVLGYFLDVEQADSAEVMAVLHGDYNDYKTFTHAGITETLMTGVANGLLEEVSSELDEHGDLRIYYRATEDGRTMIERYIA